MFERRHVFGLGLALTPLGCAGSTPEPQRAPAPRRIHIAGDSTAARFDSADPRVGWGAVLETELEGVVVNDAARSGRSSKSFLEEGHWAALLGQIQRGDLVLIQFGHNDEKPDPARATDATTSFRDFLRRYVADSRAHGGVPILITPVARRRFSARGAREVAHLVASSLAELGLV